MAADGTTGPDDPGSDHHTDSAALRRAGALTAAARRIVVLTGAGVSTDSGIPDFRGPNGVWTKDPSAEKLSSLADYVADPDVRARSWQARLVHPGWAAAPNAAHRALVELEHGGRLDVVITQNIDRLHQRAGSAPERVLELHGTMFESVCLSCSDRRDMREALDRVRAGETDPACARCGGLLKSATISFGQPLERAVLDRAQQAALRCDLLLAAGSSLTVHPAAALVGVALNAGATVIIANASPTPYDEHADTVLRGPLGEVLPALAAAR